MKNKILASIQSIVVLFMVLFLLTGCGNEDNPVEPHESHNEAEGLLLKAGSDTLVLVQEAEVKQGKLTVKTGEQTPEISVIFLAPDGDEFTPTEEESSLSLEFTDTSIAEAAISQEWSFILQGVKAGQTTVEIQLIHGDHADFKTPLIPVEVSD